MSEADRPGGDGPGGEDEDSTRAARLRVYAGGRARAGRPRPASPGEVARRLSALRHLFRFLLNERLRTDDPAAILSGRSTAVACPRYCRYQTWTAG